MEMLSECLIALEQYGLRSFGIGERGLPGATNTRGGAPINLCNMTVLIGSGMLRNILFGLISLSTGFFLALSLALLKSRNEWYLTGPARVMIYTFRGTPLLIQFFIGYLIFASFGLGVFRTAAYGASVGGLGTPVGTPPNVIFMGVYKEYGGEEIAFLDWMKIGVPAVIVLLPGIWLWLTRRIGENEASSGNRPMDRVSSSGFSRASAGE